MRLSVPTITRTFTMKPMADVFNLPFPDHLTIAVFDSATPFVPSVDPHYEFDKDSLKKVLQWLDGSFRRNLALTGPTGCGKSSLIEQVCARLNIEVWRVASHEKLEFQEMICTTQLVPGALSGSDTLLGKAASAIKALFGGTSDGEHLLEWLQRVFSSTITQQIPGPVVMAAVRGGVCLVDEVNFLPTGTVGAFNTVLDGGTIAVTETGDVITPDPGFRFAITGNSLDDGDDVAMHRGVRKMNLAFKNRFNWIRMDYMKSIREAAVLGRLVDLPGSLVEAMITVANDTRRAFKAGEIETTISTRGLLEWAKLVQAQKRLLPTAHVKLLTDTLNFALLDGANPTDGDAVRMLLQKTVENLQFSPDAATASNTSSATGETVHLLVNPNAGQPKFWGAITSGSISETIFFESMGSSPKTQTKNTGYYASKQQSKINDGYRVISLPKPEANAMLAIQKITGEYYNRLMAGSPVQVADPQHREALLLIAGVLGNQNWRNLIT